MMWRDTLSSVTAERNPRPLTLNGVGNGENAHPR